MNKYGLKWVFGSFLLLAVIGVFSIFLQLLVVIVPILITALYFKSHLRNAIIGYIIFLVSAVLIGGETTAILYLCVTFPVCVSVIWVLNEKKRMFTSVIITISSVLLGIIIFIGIMAFTTGLNVTDLILARFESAMLMDDYITKSFYFAISDQQAFTEFALSGEVPSAYAGTSLDSMRVYIMSLAADVVRSSLPVIIVIYSILSGFIGFYFSHAYLKKRDVELVNVASFGRLTVPRQPITALCIMVIASYLLSSFGLEIFNEMSSLLFMVFMTVLSVQGYATIHFFYKEKKIPLFVAILLYIITTVFGMIPWLGFFENLFKVRARYLISTIQGGDDQ
jgi:uncharacterized protein YybS (DUF2232 family)